MSKIFTAIFVLCMLSAFNCARLQRSKSTNTTNVTMSKFDEVADVMIANLTHFIDTANSSFSENATTAENEEIYNKLEKNFHQIWEWNEKAGQHLNQVFNHASEEERKHMKIAMKHVGDLVQEILKMGDAKEREIHGRPSKDEERKSNRSRRGGKGGKRGPKRGPRRGINEDYRRQRNSSASGKGPRRGINEEYGNSTRTNRSRRGGKGGKRGPKRGPRQSKFDEVANEIIANLTHFIHTNSSSENATQQILESVDEEYKRLKNVWRHATSEEEKDHMESALKHIDSLENVIRRNRRLRPREGKGGKRGPNRGPRRGINEDYRRQRNSSASGKGPRRGINEEHGNSTRTNRSRRGGKGGKRGPKRGDDKEHGNSTRTNRSMPRQNETGPSDEDLDINIEQ